MVRTTASPPSSSSSNQHAAPFSIPGVKPPGRPLRLPPVRLALVGTRPLQKRWLRRSSPLRLRRLRRMMTTTCTFLSRGRRWSQWIPGSPRRWSTMFPRTLGRRKIPHQSFTQLRCSCRHPRRSRGLEIPAPFRARVSRSCSLAGLAIREWIRWTPDHIWRRWPSMSRGVVRFPERPRLLR